MPGAPNRPPDTSPAPAPVAPTPEPPERKVLRRLVPSHVALLLETWKGPVPPDVLGPFEKAEAAFAAADYSGATNALDQLSIRFAEPRWPTLPEAFRKLRVAIPAPMPPSWDPDHSLPPAERDARRARRIAEDQVALADGCVAWAVAHGVESADLALRLAAAKSALAAEGVPSGFYPEIDALWETLRSRLPRPRSGSRAPPVVSAQVADG